MPIHDWTRVEAGIFHDFHGAWITYLRDALNSGLLPPDYYALGEQVAGSMEPDVLTLQTPSDESGNGSIPAPGTVAVATEPPCVRQIVRAELVEQTRKRRSLVIRHVSNHRIVALLEIVSPGNKASRHALRSFVNKVLGSLEHGIHLLLIDLFPPGPRDPQGIHGVIWEELTGEIHEQPPDKPLTLVAYSAGSLPVGYFEPAAVGDTLPEMPLFLDVECYVKTPLEATYTAAYAGVPRFYREILEAESS
jgi:hypothetical protein